MSASYNIPAESFGAATIRAAVRSTAVIPDFSHTNDVVGVSGLLADYALSNTGYLSVILPLLSTITANDTFCLAVRYTNAAGDTVRYVLHKPYGVTLLFPTYEGQTIGPSAVFEIWSNPAEATAAADEDLHITLGELTVHSSSAAGFVGPISGVTYTLTGVEV